MPQRRFLRGALEGLALIALLALAALLALNGREWEPYEPSGDPRYYIRYVNAVSEQGLAAFPALFREYLSDPQHWVFPPPSRIGYVLAALPFTPASGADTLSLSALSLAAFVATVAISFVFARRWLDAPQAFASAALVACSPLLLGLSRLALTDTFNVLGQALCLWLFLEYLRSPASRLWQVAFALAFAFACATKEIAVLLAVPLGLHALIEHRRERRVSLTTTAALLVLPGLAVVVLWIVAAGGADTAWRTMRIVLLSPASNPFAIHLGGGGWHRYPIDQILVSPWFALFANACVGLTLVRWRRGEYDRLRVGMALVCVCQVAVLGLFTKNLRYVAILEAPLCVLAALTLADFAAAGRPRASRPLLATAVVLLGLAGIESYRELWVKRLLEDPLTRTLAYDRDLLLVGPERSRARGGSER